VAKSTKGEDAKERTLRLHRTVDVPQANRLENIRQLAAAVRDGVSHPAALQELLNVDARHFAYYRQAAIILGILRSGGEDLELTDAGRRLLSTVERSGDERECFRDLIVGARALKPFASFFRGEPTPLPEIAHRLGVMAGLAHSTALRRAQTLFQWRHYIDGSREASGDAGAALPDTSSQVESMIARHNALAKQLYLERLLRLNPTQFEELVGRLVTAMGFQNVQVVGGARDGGVDVTAQKLDDWGQPVPVLLQVKRYQKPVGRRVIDELLGVLHRNRQPHGVLVTTSDFSTQALEVAKGEANLRLVNGAQLVDLTLKHGVGVRVGRYGEILFE
jgi:hypothetical protein